jgi:hypothetical protein
MRLVIMLAGLAAGLFVTAFCIKLAEEQKDGMGLDRDDMKQAALHAALIAGAGVGIAVVIVTAIWLCVTG